MAGAGLDRAIDGADVATGAEGALALACDDDRLDRGVARPCGQSRVKRADHAEGERVQRLRPTQGDEGDAALDRNANVGSGTAAVVHCWSRRRAMITRM